jgi:hypothetical protein
MKKTNWTKEIIKIAILTLWISLILLFFLQIGTLSVMLTLLLIEELPISMPTEFFEETMGLGILSLPVLAIVIPSIVLAKPEKLWLCSIPVQLVVYSIVTYFKYGSATIWIIGSILLLQGAVMGIKWLIRYLQNRNKQTDMVEQS